MPVFPPIGKVTIPNSLNLREYCSRRGWKDVEVITDVTSGAKSSREGWIADAGSPPRKGRCCSLL